jgi:excisionase family DNA binding protein
MASNVPHDVIFPSSAHVAELERLRDLLAELAAAGGGAVVELPESAVAALVVVVDAMLRGDALTVVPRERDLTTQEAADLLRVSRPHLIKLLDAGEIPYHRVGSHRRLRLEDVLRYRERRDSERRERLSELTRLSEEVQGGYR